MNLKLEDLILIASLLASLLHPHSWTTVCIILICAVIKCLCLYFSREPRNINLEKLEEKINKISQEVKALNLRAGFQRT